MQQPSAYMITARKWRPQRFAEVVGQEHVTRTLRNALKQHRVHHAYLFAGPRGVGKTTTARILAKAVNCLNMEDGEPCNQCQSCQAFLEGRSMDVLEIDGASHNSVDDVRMLRENAKYPPKSGRYKIYIIDEVHMLSTAAFNALLKTLEEPPPHLLFIFATTEPQKLPATIISRCQRFDFRRMSIPEIVRHLTKIADAEEIEVEEEALLTIARKADGSMRDAQSIFDQLVAFSGAKITYADVQQTFHLIDQQFFFEVEKTLAQGDLHGVFQIVQQLFAQGYDFSEFLSGLVDHYRNLLAVVATGSADLVTLTPEWQQQYKERAKAYSQAALLNVLSVLTYGEQQLKFASNPRIYLEVLLAKVALLDSALDLAQLLEQLQSPNAPSSAKSSQLKTAVAETAAPYQTTSSASSPSPPAGEKPPAGKTSREKPVKLTQEFVLRAIQESETFRGIRRLLLRKDMVKITVDGNAVKITPSDPFVGETLAQRQQVLAQLLSEKCGQSVSVEIEGIKKPTIHIFENLDTTESPTPQPSRTFTEGKKQANATADSNDEAVENEAERKLKDFFDLKRVK